MEFDYPCKLVKVVDGDTVDLMIDLGFFNWHQERIRLWGVNTPELRRGSDEQKAKGQEAKKFVEDWFKRNSSSTVRVTVGMKKTKREIDKYGRWIGDIYLKNELTGRTERLSDELIYRELAEPMLDGGYYTGKGKEQLDVEEEMPLDTPELT